MDDLFDEAILNPSSSNLWGSQDKENRSGGPNSPNNPYNKLLTPKCEGEDTATPSHDSNDDCKPNIDNDYRGKGRLKAYISNLAWVRKASTYRRVNLRLLL